uniref:Uncharacterized protein n=1 Tax=Tetranychus urticae TaxID=32264 RepID=T1KN35_TETUR
MFKLYSLFDERSSKLPQSFRDFGDVRSDCLVFGTAWLVDERRIWRSILGFGGVPGRSARGTASDSEDESSSSELS